MDSLGALEPADRAFLEISMALAREVDPGRITAIALKGAIKLAGADRGRAYLLDAEMRRLHCHAVHPDVPTEAEFLDMDDPKLSQSPLVHCLRHGRPVVIDDAYRYSGYGCECIYGWDNALLPGRFQRTQRLIAVALRDHSDRAIGALVVQYCSDDGTAVDADLPAQLVRFTRHAATAVTAARLAKENEHLQALVQKNVNPSVPKRGRSTRSGTDRYAAAFAPLIGDSPAIRAARHLAERAAPTAVTVMLQGETGTGKDVMARAIHDASPRSDKPFVAQNCAAIPHTMLEAELFGWEKGAFSGAHAAHPGLIASAHGGTLFLDEIGDMPLELQPKLLRVLQDGKVRALGATSERDVDIRIIVATHRDLEAKVANGSFRADLYYRLAVFPIRLAPLRDRPEDLVPLARHFLALCRDSLGSTITDVAPDVLRRLARHSWPGNVRELRNAVERAVLMTAPGAGTWDELPDFEGADGCDDAEPVPWPELTAIPLKEAIEQVESHLIRRQLAETGGNLTTAASRLGLPRRTLAYKIQRYEIEGAPVAKSRRGREYPLGPTKTRN